MEQLTFDLTEQSPAVRRCPDRPCANCGTMFAARTSNSTHCVPCQQERRATLKAAAHRRRSSGENDRFCADCGVQMAPTRGRPSERCPDCRPLFKASYDVQRNRERTESGARREYDVKWREGNRVRIRENNRRYKAAHPETDLAAIHRRRQRSEAGMDDIDRLLSRLYRLAIHDDPCFYCGSAKTHEVDHFFPLSKGGTDHWWNLVRSCRPCNRGVNGKGTACGTAFLLRTGAFVLTAA